MMLCGQKPGEAAAATAVTARTADIFTVGCACVVVLAIDLIITMHNLIVQ